MFARTRHIKRGIMWSFTFLLAWAPEYFYTYLCDSCSHYCYSKYNKLWPESTAGIIQPLLSSYAGDSERRGPGVGIHMSCRRVSRHVSVFLSAKDQPEAYRYDWPLKDLFIIKDQSMFCLTQGKRSSRRFLFTSKPYTLPVYYQKPATRAPQ